MTTPAPNEQLYQRFRRLIPKSRDLTLILLKGHLLIEELLRDFLEGMSEHPSAVRDAKLTFFQRFRVAQALSVMPIEHKLWKLIRELNRLRNELSHHAEVRALEEEVDRLVRPFCEPGFKRSNSPRDRATRLVNTFALALGFLSGFIDGELTTRKEVQKSRAKTSIATR